MKTNKIIFLLVAIGFFCMLSGCEGNKMITAKTTSAAPNKTTTNNAAPKNLQGKKILVAYYSWSGNTKKVAEQIHQEVGGDIFEIKTVKQYPTTHAETSKVAEQEMKSKARPELASKVTDMKSYDVIILGYPIWWYTAPMAVNTFLDSYDFKGKTILPFCTSGGYGVTKSVEDIRKEVKDAKVLNGLLANDSSTVNPWLEQAGVL